MTEVSRQKYPCLFSLVVLVLKIIAKIKLKVLSEFLLAEIIEKSKENKLNRYISNNFSVCLFSNKYYCKKTNNRHFVSKQLSLLIQQSDSIYQTVKAYKIVTYWLKMQ